ncbi:MAG: transglutaminase domain-containing protein, partial [Eubacteriales bacterium]|nr:transglutaminase domain-containing protein [Eubacteriales bacterium]
MSTWWSAHKPALLQRIFFHAAQLVMYLLIAGGICQAAFAVLGTPLSGVYTVLLLAAGYLLWQLGCKRWWILPALLAVVTAAALVSLRWSRPWLSGIWDGLLQAWFAAGNILYGAGDEAALTLPLVAPIAGVVSLVCYALVCRWRQFWPAALLCAALFGLGWVMDWHQVLPYAGMALCGVLMLLGVSRYAPRRDNTLLASTALSAGAVALLAVLLSFTLVPGDTQLSQWKWLRLQVGDINDVLANYTGWTDLYPRDLFTINEAGFAGADGRLGGPVTLDKDHYLRVTAPSGLLLRGSIQNAYTGNRWYNSIGWGQHRFGSLLWNSRQQDVFNWNIAGWDDLTLEARRLLAQDAQLTIQHLRTNTSTLFGAGRVRNVTSRVGDGLLPYFDKNGEMFSRYYVSKNYAYDVDTQLILCNDATFDTLMHRLTAQNGVPDSATQAEMDAYYLALPDSLPQWVVQKTQEVTAGAASPYAKAAAIRDYLQALQYTLTPAQVPDDEDFVAYFLQTGEGYCTYFASAMAVMARCAGIPSRYVEGFLVPNHSDSAPCLISGEQAHAWAELYFTGIGWVPMDATPSQGLADTPTPDTSRPQGTQTMPPMETPPPDALDIDDAGGPPMDLGWLWKSLLALAGAALVLGPALPWALHGYSLSRRRIARLYPGGDARLEVYYANAVLVLREFEDKLKPGDTPYAVARQMDRWLRVPSGSMMDLTEMVVRLRYAQQPPTPDELLWAHAFTHDLERLLREFLGFWGYYR